jgi:hypothetical protein
VGAVARPDAELQPVGNQSVKALRFPATIFLSAFLLFQVQPIMGRYVLPWFGGGPAVWTTCLLFFQVVLLAGYAYAHWLGSRNSARLQGSLHILMLLVSLLFLPIIPRVELWNPATSSDPSGRILLLLAATVGGPYLLLASTGPLLQRWFHLSEPSRSPWRLYALSNFGSFAALFSYPFVVEPFVRLHTQVSIWSVLYVLFAALCGWTAWRMRVIKPKIIRSGIEAGERPTAWAIVFWLALSMCGSVLLLATTNQISQDIAVNPFLWVAALSIYLLTFILVFESERFYRRILFATGAGILAPVACIVPSLAGTLSIPAQLALYLAAMFFACMLCHGELARSRPSPQFLTAFYLTIAAGGALGGVFVALIAPRIFTEFSEYPVGLAAACLLGFIGWMRGGALAMWTRGNFAIRIPLMALLLGGITSIMAGVTMSNLPSVASARNFYGILRVMDKSDRNGPLRELRHGTIRHGFQYLKQPQRSWPTTYYGPHSGVATVLTALDHPNRQVAIIGLGTGTIAAWGHLGDTFRFYEINPDVEAMARTWFTFLKDSGAHTEVVLGDARVQLESELRAGHSHDFDVIAVDAFSSDAIPLHLLTAECGDIYKNRLKPGGLLLLHISNRILDLQPVARGLAQHLAWGPFLFISGDDSDTGESSSTWVLITNNAEFLSSSGIANQNSPWTHRAPIMWTDDFASLWHVLKF